MENKIIIKSTGEIIDLDKKISAMTDIEKSDTLSKINLIRRLTSKLEKAIKKWIKENVELKFDDETKEIFFEDWRITQVNSARFSEKTLLAGDNEKDKKDWMRLKRKYSIAGSYIKFG